MRLNLYALFLLCISLSVVVIGSPVLVQYVTTSVDQLIDHNCGASCGTFSQRVIFNNSLAHGSTPPLLLLVGGEYEVESWWGIMGAEASSLAAAEGAVVAALEHRYFGASFPMQPPSLANLSTLNPAIAAKDVLTALPQILSVIPLSSNTRVVLLGCSYSGTVATYTQSTPSISGIYASSSPVQPQVDMESYHVTMAQALADPLAGGSPQCSALVTSALQNASRMMASKDFNELAEAWGSCSPITAISDARFMFYNTVDLAFGSTYVQENDELYIPFVCNYLLNATKNGATPSQAWRQLLVNVTWAYPSNCVPGGGTGEWAGYIAEIAYTNATYPGSSSVRTDRQWWFLQCAHVGWLHTCTSGGGCPYAAPGVDFDPLPSEWYEELCLGAFGLRINDTAAGVAALEPLAAATRNSSYIFAINGDDDPWHVFGLLPPPTSNRILIDGTWHCADMSTPTPRDPQGLVAAREAIALQVNSWFTANGGSASSNAKKTLSTGAKVGIAVGSAVFIIAVGWVAFSCYKQKKLKGVGADKLLDQQL